MDYIKNYGFIGNPGFMGNSVIVLGIQNMMKKNVILQHSSSSESFITLYMLRMQAICQCS